MVFQSKILLFIYTFLLTIQRVKLESINMPIKLKINVVFHPYVLQTPIIIDGNNYLIGYNEDEIRKFLPKEYRRHRLLSE